MKKTIRWHKAVIESLVIQATDIKSGTWIDVEITIEFSCFEDLIDYLYPYSECLCNYKDITDDDYIVAQLSGPWKDVMSTLLYLKLFADSNKTYLSNTPHLSLQEELFEQLCEDLMNTEYPEE